MNANRLISLMTLVIFIGACVGSFCLGRATKKTEPITAEVERDTVIIRDTFTEYYPKYITQWRTRTVRVEAPVADTTKNCDAESVSNDSVTVDLPITERVYEDENYRAVVEGYNPILKEFAVYPKTQIVTATETITKRKHWGVSLGVQGGYGITPHGMQPYAGVGISFGITF